MSVNFNLPAGRIVAGSPTFKQDKDMQGRPKDKPNWFMAVAVRKDQPGVNEVLQLIFQTAQAGYAANQNVLQRINAGLCNPPQFRWKIDDGDNPEDPKNRGKEGYAGCWIFKFSTTFGVMNCCDAHGNPIDPATVKTGYWVDLSGSVDINKNTDHTAGVYLNPTWVRLIGYDQEIISGPTPAQAFNGVPVQLPPGVSATPVSPAGGMPGQQPMQQQPMQQQPMQQQPMQQQQQQQQPAMQPQGPGFANNPPAAFGGGQQPAGGFTGNAPAAGMQGNQPPQGQWTPQGQQGQPAQAGGNFSNQPSAPSGTPSQTGTGYPNQYPGAQPHTNFVGQ